MKHKNYLFTVSEIQQRSQLKNSEMGKRNRRANVSNVWFNRKSAKKIKQAEKIQVFF
jgi:hypothetical protein